MSASPCTRPAVTRFPWSRFVGMAAFLLLLARPAAGQAPTAPPGGAQSKESLREQRDRFREEVDKLKDVKRLDQAAAALRRLVALERQLSGDLHDDVLKALEELAVLEEQREDLAASRTARQEILAARTRLLGKDHWKTVDARLAVERLDQLRTLEPAKRRELADVSHQGIVWVSFRRPAEIDKGVFVSGSVPFLYLDQSGGYYALHKREHLESARERLEKVLAFRKAALGDYQEEDARTLTNLGLLAARLNDYSGAQKYLKEALAVRRRVEGPGHPETAKALTSLGVRLQDSDPPAAQKCLEEALAIQVKVLGPEHADALETLNDLGGLFLARKDFAQARSCYQRVLDLCTRTRGEKHPETADALVHLGKVLQAQTDYAAARGLYERALAIRKEAFGERHEKTAASLEDLGDLLFDQKKYPEARSILEKALAVLGEAEKEGGPEAADLLWLLGGVCRRQPDLAAAARCWEQALGIRLKVQGEERAETAALLHNLGALYKERNEYARARPYLERAYAVRRKVLGEEHADTFVSLNNLGHLLFEQGDYAAARPLIEQALALCRKIHGESHPDTAISFTLAGRLLKRQRDNAGAQKYFEQAVAVYARALGETHHDTISALLTLATSLRDQGDWTAARTTCERALALATRAHGDEHPDTVLALNGLGGLFLKKGEQQEARRYLERALAILNRLPKEQQSLRAVVLTHLAVSWYREGEHARARPLLDQAAASLRATPDQEAVESADIFDNLGVMLDAQESYTDARRCLEEAVTLRTRALGDHEDTAKSLAHLAQCLKGQGETAEARGYLTKALAIRRKVLGPRHPETARTLNDLGVMLDDPAAARKCHEEALAIMKEARGERHPDTAQSLLYLGVFLHNQGENAAARKCLEQVLSIYQGVERDKARVAQVLHILGLVAAAEGDAEKALRYFEEARTGAQEGGLSFSDRGSILNTLGRRYALKGDYTRALQYHEQALAAYRKVSDYLPETAATLNSLGAVYHLRGDYENSRKYLGQAIQLTQQGLELAAAGQSERQQLAKANEYRYRLDALLTLAHDGNLSAADTYSLQLTWKGAVFDRQRRTRLLRAQPELAPLAESLESASRRLAGLALAAPGPKEATAWKQRLVDLTKEKEALERELAHRAVTYRKEQERSKLRPEELVRLLPEGVALVDFFEYGHFVYTRERGGFVEHRRLTASVLRKGRPVVRLDLGPTEPIAAAIDRWGTTLTSRLPARGGQDVAASVREMVWDPVEDYLEGARTVLISPDGALGKLPFAALPGKEQGKYLLEELAVAVVPVPRLLPELLETAPDEVPGPPPSLLLVGDVDYDVSPGQADAQGARRAAPRGLRDGALQRWPSLPGTKAEVQAIARSFHQRFGDGPVTRLEQARATEGALRHEAGRHRYLHLATHGFFAPSELTSALDQEPNPGAGAAAAPEGPDDFFRQRGVTGYHPGLLSGLVLAGANRPPEADRDDGILTAVEVAELDLSKVDLAVLSACQTGLGKAAGGEGLLGLQRAFQVAGARTVVASLWQVPDAATQALMAEFYANLWDRGRKLGKLEALRQAQLTLLRRYDSSAGRLRGAGARVTVPPEEKARVKPEMEAGHTPPFYWAAFVLSGDWR